MSEDVRAAARATGLTGIANLRLEKLGNGNSPPEQAPDAAEWRGRLLEGGSFILDAPSEIPAIWGEHDQVVWAEGEPIMFVGPEGVGKTTVAQQVVLARVGIIPSVLGLPVVVGKRRVLYLACDRPRQVQRSFARMVSEPDRDLLNERLVIWKGPPPGDFGRHPNALFEMCQAADADTVVIDSTKDVALKLSDDETGAGFNSAMQTCVAEDIEVLALHHARKRAQGGDKPKTLDDVYGSRWLTAGCGSVVLLWGEAGDPIVEWSHLKQPSEPVGPFKIIHSHRDGTSAIHNPADLLGMMRASKVGITAEGAARVIFDKEQPTKNEVEKARYKLDGLVRKELAHKKPGGTGSNGQQLPTFYVAITRLEDVP